MRWVTFSFMKISNLVVEKKATKHVHSKHLEIDLAKKDLADAWRVLSVTEPRSQDSDVRETHWCSWNTVREGKFRKVFGKLRYIWDRNCD